MERGTQRQRGKEDRQIPSISPMDFITEDLLHNILSRLPATSCASAACVSRTWCATAARLLSLPKLSSAFSLNPCLRDAASEVLDKLLKEPIRPQFAIASVGPGFSLNRAHRLITEKLGGRIPVIAMINQGIIGFDAVTNDFQEVQWEVTDDDEVDGNPGPNANRGLLLTIGSFPGLKVSLIPLMEQFEGASGVMVDKFVMDIKEYTSSISGSASPAAIMLFSERGADMKPVMQKMDYAFSSDTVIVGGGSEFLFWGDRRRHSTRNVDQISAGVALLFAREREKPPGIGETQFYATLSTGVSPIGPIYRAVSVREKRRGEISTWLTAKRDGFRENLDGQTMLEHIYDEIGDRIQYPAFYIGVTKRRKCSLGLEKVKWLTHLEFHEVQGGDDEYLFVNDGGIKTGDSFRFYVSNSKVASESCKKVSEELGCLRLVRMNQDPTNSANNDKKMIFGGMLFCCCGRGESFFGHPFVDSLPLLETFPRVGGTFCAGEIYRGTSISYDPESQEQSSTFCSLHVFSTVYLVMAYTPAAMTIQ